jgi:hypothetical protein
MHPVRVYGGYVFASTDGDVSASGGTGCVAREGRVGGFEDGVVGDPLSLWHPCGGILYGLVTVRVIAVSKVSQVALIAVCGNWKSWSYPGYHMSPTV